jgi:hypothetical protein
MLGRFYRTQEALDLLDKAIGSWLEEAGKKESADLLWTVMSYLRGVLLHVPFARTLEETPHWTAWFDVEAWRGDGYQKALADYLFAYPRTLTTAVDPARKALLEQRLATFGEHPAGLGKFTRTLFAQDLRRSVVAIADGTPLHSEVTHDCKV